MLVSGVGIVSDITFANGNSNGKDWTKTNFKLTEFFSTQNGETKSRVFFVSSFKTINLVEGGTYLIGGELRNVQDQNKNWRTEVQVQYAYPLGNQPAQPQPQQNYGGYQQQPQQPQYNNQYQQQPNYGYQQQAPQQNFGYQQAPQRPPVNSINGQENFTNDDIPF